MKSLVILASLCLTGVARAETPPLLTNEDFARITAARGNERLYCARLVKDGIDAERGRCVSACAGDSARPTPAQERCIVESGCRSLRNEEYSAMGQVLMAGGGIQEGAAEFTLGVMARSGCPGVFLMQRVAPRDVIVERTRWSQSNGQYDQEYFTAVEPRRQLRVPAPQEPRRGEDLVNDLQAQAEDLLGVDVNDRLRCGISAMEVPGYSVRNGQVVIGSRETAFAGCTWSNRAH